MHQIILGEFDVTSAAENLLSLSLIRVVHFGVDSKMSCEGYFLGAL